MKKLLSVLLAVVLMMSLSVTAFATSYTAPADAEVPVTATYLEGGAGGTVFSVDVEWTEMEFTYQAAKWAQWDPVNHTYSDAVPASWSGSGTVTITNHSNTALDVTPTYEKSSGYESANIVFKDGETAVSGTVVIDSAADTNAAVVKTITVTPGGKLASGASETQIGTIKVTIAKSDYVSVATANALIDDMAALMTELTEADNRYYTLMNSREVLAYAVNQGDQVRINTAYADALALYNSCMEA